MPDEFKRRVETRSRSTADRVKNQADNGLNHHKSGGTLGYWDFDFTFVSRYPLIASGAGPIVNGNCNFRPGFCTRPHDWTSVKIRRRVTTTRAIRLRTPSRHRSWGCEPLRRCWEGEIFASGMHLRQSTTRYGLRRVRI